jgi:hypothetical protein
MILVKVLLRSSSGDRHNRNIHQGSWKRSQGNLITIKIN